MNIQNAFLTNPVQVPSVTARKFYLTWIIVIWRGKTMKDVCFIVLLHWCRKCHSLMWTWCHIYFGMWISVCFCIIEEIKRNNWFHQCLQYSLHNEVTVTNCTEIKSILLMWLSSQNSCICPVCPSFDFETSSVPTLEIWSSCYEIVFLTLLYRPVS
jgi:hypothetical protein